MQFLASLVAFALVPFALIAMLPFRVALHVAAGLAIAAIAFSFATAGGLPAVPTTLVVSGLIAGVITNGVRTALTERDAPWHARLMTVTAGAAACLPVWLALTLGMGLLAAGV